MSWPGADRLTALVADDFDAARHLFTDALNESQRFRVVAQAANGEEAVAAAASHQVDLALLDLAMPVAGGLDVIEDINHVASATRVVVVSSFPGRGIETLVLARGAAGYVRKQPSIRAMIDEIVLTAGVLDIAQAVLSERRRFPRDLTSARQARRFIEEILVRWECQPAIDTLELILSEVVTNAVVHGKSDPEVAVRLVDGALRVEVLDNSDVSIPEVRPADDLAVGGRGLSILHSEATRWGSTPVPGGGKSVWFEVPVFGPTRT